VYAARAADVCLTLCDGQVLYDDGHWPALNAPVILSHAHAARRKLSPLQAPVSPP
jgi:5-methylthioadenosine/S-adenosylhomocysteine deaminase